MCVWEEVAFGANDGECDEQMLEIKVEGHVTRLRVSSVAQSLSRSVAPSSLSRSRFPILSRLVCNVYSERDMDGYVAADDEAPR